MFTFISGTNNFNFFKSLTLILGCAVSRTRPENCDLNITVLKNNQSNKISLSISQLHNHNSLKKSTIIYAIGKRNKAGQHRNFALHNRNGKEDEFINKFLGI